MFNVIITSVSTGQIIDRVKVKSSQDYLEAVREQIGHVKVEKLTASGVVIVKHSAYRLLYLTVVRERIELDAPSNMELFA